uniref:Reverse transcriptase domain-containing protein n=1 Tax=Seriola dumerili TaxID=41447 RepID=A0A3B4VIU4_SERDU
MVTGVVFVDLSAAYDTVNHRCLLSKILETTRDIRLTELIESMLENRHFFVELGGKKSRWQRLKNGLSQGSVLAPLLFNIYTKDQPKSADTRRFIYADDLGIGAQATDFKIMEDRLSNALTELTPYYEENHLRANPSKTQVCAFHLRNREAKRQLKASWSGTSLEHCEHPVYLGLSELGLRYFLHPEGGSNKTPAAIKPQRRKNLR